MEEVGGGVATKPWQDGEMEAVSRAIVQSVDDMAPRFQGYRAGFWLSPGKTEHMCWLRRYTKEFHQAF